MVNTYRIVLADDHELFRLEVRKILDRTFDLEVVGEAGDGLELLSLLVAVKAHMAILDISMPKISGLAAISEVKQKHSGVKVLFLTMHKDDVFLQQAISLGAEGYLLKENVDRELFPAISMIRRGQVFFPSLTDYVQANG